MGTISIHVADGAAFKNYDEVLEHIHEKLRSEGIVKDSYLNALREREAEYPTGILLDGYSVAIPHCDSKHANHPSIYIIRLPEPVLVNQADGDEKLWIKLVVNLVVTDPTDQLQLLKALFSRLQMEDFYHKLLELPADEAKELFISTIIQQQLTGVFL
ncbi:PTS galactitol transporter subunit IIA [Pectobacterium versatile]|uniref:PTS galactitol transporter subunit IIA n=1 Tax=Pectobacterium versatile TaxID=2488639 RepID=UPI001F1AF7A2|nr:PTS galactitol transporter subunit IIA [Pectobacterium versatile]